MNDEFPDYFQVIIIAYLYLDSWLTAFHLRKINKRLDELEKEREKGDRIKWGI